MAGQAGPEEEMVEIGVTAGITTGAVLLERHARKQEAKATEEQKGKRKDPDLWDASDIRKFRQQDKATREAQRIAQAPTGQPISAEQLTRADALATNLDMPSVKTLAESMTAQEAEKYLAQLEATAGISVPPQQSEHQLPMQESEAPVSTLPEDIMIKQEPHHPELHRPETWRTGDVPATEAQVKWLTTKGGLPLEEAMKMTKAGASSYRNSQERAQGLTQAPKGPKIPPGRSPGRGI